DAYFANRFFRRHAPAGETINEDLSAVGTGRGTGHCLCCGGERVRIVGKNIQIRSLQYQRVGVVFGIRVQAAPVRHSDHLFGGRNYQTRVVSVPGRLNFDGGIFVVAEAGGNDLQNVSSRHQAGKRVSSLVIGGRGLFVAGGGSNRYRG